MTTEEYKKYLDKVADVHFKELYKKVKPIIDEQEKERKKKALRRIKIISEL